MKVLAIILCVSIVAVVTAVQDPLQHVLQEVEQLKRSNEAMKKHYDEKIATLEQQLKWCTESGNFLPPANEVCEGYVFTPVCHSVRGGGMRGGGHAWHGACMAGSMHGGGHAWKAGACMVGHVRQSRTCMAGGVCDGGSCMAGGNAWHTCPPR